MVMAFRCREKRPLIEVPVMVKTDTFPPCHIYKQDLMKMNLQTKRASPAHLKERAYPKQVTQEINAERCGELRFRTDETIFPYYDKAEMRIAKILVIVCAYFLNTQVLVLARCENRP